MPKKVIHRKKNKMWINNLLIHKVIHIKQKMWIILKFVLFLDNQRMKNYLVVRSTNTNVIILVNKLKIGLKSPICSIIAFLTGST